MSKTFNEWEPVFPIEKEGNVLLIIDMQNGFLEKGSPLEVPMARQQLPQFKKLLAACREQSIPIIYTQFYVSSQSHYTFYWNIARQRGLQLTEPMNQFALTNHETQLYPEIAPTENDYILPKYGYDCFAETDLEQLLHSLNCKNLLVSGTVLNWCVDSTVRTAYHKHLNVTVLEDVVSTYSHAGLSAEQWHAAELNLIAEAFGRVLSVDQLLAELQK